jgi:hypothetical protein
MHVLQCLALKCDFLFVKLLSFPCNVSEGEKVSLHRNKKVFSSQSSLFLSFIHLKMNLGPTKHQAPCITPAFFQLFVHLTSLHQKFQLVLLFSVAGWHHTPCPGPVSCCEAEVTYYLFSKCSSLGMEDDWEQCFAHCLRAPGCMSTASISELFLCTLCQICGMLGVLSSFSPYKHLFSFCGWEN